MRLGVVDKEFAWPAKAFAALLKRMTKGEAPDVIKTHLYRPNVFGRWASPAFQDVMRGPSPWSPGERELFAAYTSRLLQCPF